MVWSNRRVHRRRIVDAAIGMMSIAAVVLVIVAIDGRAPAQILRLVHGEGAVGGGTSLPGSTALLARSGWDLASMHAPLAGFAAVAVVLVLCMIRMK